MAPTKGISQGPKRPRLAEGLAAIVRANLKIKPGDAREAFAELSAKHREQAEAYTVAQWRDGPMVRIRKMLSDGTTSSSVHVPGGRTGSRTKQLLLMAAADMFDGEQSVASAQQAGRLLQLQQHAATLASGAAPTGPSAAFGAPPPTGAMMISDPAMLEVLGRAAETWSPAQLSALQLSGVDVQADILDKTDKRGNEGLYKRKKRQGDEDEDDELTDNDEEEEDPADLSQVEEGLDEECRLLQLQQAQQHAATLASGAAPPGPSAAFGAPPPTGAMTLDAPEMLAELGRAAPTWNPAQVTALQQLGVNVQSEILDKTTERGHEGRKKRKKRQGDEDEDEDEGEAGPSSRPTPTTTRAGRNAGQSGSQ